MAMLVLGRVNQPEEGTCFFVGGKSMWNVFPSFQSVAGVPRCSLSTHLRPRISMGNSTWSTWASLQSRWFAAKKYISHRAHGTGIFTYTFTIHINQILGKYISPMNSYGSWFRLLGLFFSKSVVKKWGKNKTHGCCTFFNVGNYTTSYTPNVMVLLPNQRPFLTQDLRSHPLIDTLPENMEPENGGFQ